MTTIYIRTLKRAEHTVFCVQDGQKFYYDSQFNRSIPFSSGQQIKRSIMEKLSLVINQQPAPTTFLFDVTKKDGLKEGEVFATCDPSYPDQLFGGWMKAAKGGETKTLKRRSPLSISAMRGLHPLLAGVYKENVSFDRNDRSNNIVIIRDETGKQLSEEDIENLLSDQNRSLTRKWIPDNRRAGGLFVQDIAIDLRRLFSVTLNPYEPEISKETEMNLREQGWGESVNVFGKCLVAPLAVREKLIPALAEAVIEWNITSNQARTFSLAETLAVAISDNANKISASIRAKLSEEDDDKAYPIIAENLEGISTYVTLAAGGYVRTNTESYNALEDAKAELIRLMSSFDYESVVE